MGGYIAEAKSNRTENAVFRFAKKGFFYSLYVQLEGRAAGKRSLLAELPLEARAR
jgi:hypothetical protein